MILSRVIILPKKRRSLMLISSIQTMTCFHNLKHSRERGSGDEVAGSKCPEEFEDIVGEGRYSPNQIFNFDEVRVLEKKVKADVYFKRSQRFDQCVAGWKWKW
jgi:hypothetical protein